MEAVDTQHTLLQLHLCITRNIRAKQVMGCPIYNASARQPPRRTEPAFIAQLSARKSIKQHITLEAPNSGHLSHRLDTGDRQGARNRPKIAARLYIHQVSTREKGPGKLLPIHAPLLQQDANRPSHVANSLIHHPLLLTQTRMDVYTANPLLSDFAPNTEPYDEWNIRRYRSWVPDDRVTYHCYPTPFPQTPQKLSSYRGPDAVLLRDSSLHHRCRPRDGV